MFVNRTCAGQNSISFFHRYIHKMVYLKTLCCNLHISQCRSAFFASEHIYIVYTCPVLPCAFYFLLYCCCSNIITYLYIYYLGTNICFKKRIYIHTHSCDNNAYRFIIFGNWSLLVLLGFTYFMLIFCAHYYDGKRIIWFQLTHAHIDTKFSSLFTF
jgi:hypothetical protein